MKFYMYKNNNIVCHLSPMKVNEKSGCRSTILCYEFEN